MDIKELSIGDWMQYKGRAWQVCSLYQFTEEVGLWRKDSQFCENISDIEPIPITPEILEKNGWVEYSDVRNSWKLDIADYMRVWMFKNSHDWAFQVINWESEYNHEMAKAYITSIHQLQNAIRLAGLGKEIVL